MELHKDLKKKKIRKERPVVATMEGMKAGRLGPIWHLVDGMEWQQQAPRAGSARAEGSSAGPLA